MSNENKPKGKTSTYIAAVILIVIILAGAGYYYFSKPPATMQTTTGAKPLYKDTIVVGTTDSVQSTIDPADAYDYFGDRMINNLGSPLVDYRPGTTTIVPALATDWTVTPDSQTWTFNLRQGVKFSDGTAFNASVVKYSID